MLDFYFVLIKLINYNVMINDNNYSNNNDNYIEDINIRMMVIIVIV